MNWNKVIFLAHAKEDKSFVRNLYKKLKESGLEPWLDEENLMPGVQWDSKIKEAIKKSRFFLACLSHHSVSKNGYIQKELRLALSELEKKASDVIYFIPAMIEDVELPDIQVGTISLRDYQAAQIFNEEGLNRLIKNLQENADIIAEVKKKENPNFQKLRDSISNGQIDTALRLLLDYVKHRDDDLYNNVILISNRHNRIAKDNILGLISREDYSMESNRVVYSILEIIRIIEEKDHNLR